jgi:hypothetical protein
MVAAEARCSYALKHVIEQANDGEAHRHTHAKGVVSKYRLE